MESLAAALQVTSGHIVILSPVVERQSAIADSFSRILKEWVATHYGGPLYQTKLQERQEAMDGTYPL
jgi:hypothetical protein